jgi:primosomal protein N' (replication factor Y)
MLLPNERNSTSTNRFADIILPLNLPRILTYGIPSEMQDMLKIGMSVEVTLGKNKQYSGIVSRIHNEKPEQYEVKPIRNIIDPVPLVNEKQLEFWQWIAHYYMAAPGEVMQSALPAHLKMSGETTIIWAPVNEDVVEEWKETTYPVVEALQERKELLMSEVRKIAGNRHFAEAIRELLEKETIIINDTLESVYKPRTERVVSLSSQYRDDEALHKLFDELQRAPKQLNLLMAYTELSLKNNIVKQFDLLERTGASSAQVKALADKGIFEISEVAIDRIAYNKATQAAEFNLTTAQQQALYEINAGLVEKHIAVLQGVTGSGKTLLYIQKIKECIVAGRQAIFLLPEIGLTTQLVSRLYAYFGEELGVYHSRFSNNERVEIWEKVKNGTYKVVVGPRSVLWLPFANPGLVIVDEEHDASYKQKDPAPRFHARDAAIYFAAMHGADVILGSATPSIESLYNAEQGKYALVHLKERFQGVEMPTIVPVNAKSLETLRTQGARTITPELQDAIQICLNNKKQVILFQNRRGYAPFQMCTSCGWVPHCKNCDVSLTYHKSSDKLHCHYCGLKSAVIQVCPACGSNQLRSKTFGTEKIEEEVQQLFPNARVARMDIDSMRAKQGYTTLLDKLEKKKVDILVGTQMVVKGLDFASVALVGILNADSLLTYPDFRVNERAFQLMEQVSGRAGRSDGSGRVLIQAYNLQHPVLQWVVSHDVEAMYKQEIKHREFFAYPPFSRLIKISFKHKEEQRANSAAAYMLKELEKIQGIILQGPAPAVVSRIRNMYIYEILVKCPRDKQIIEATKHLINEQKQIITGTKGYSGLQIIPDVDAVI